MSQEISGDPVTDLSGYTEGRYVFSAQEDNIASLLNDNWRKAVDLAEKFDSEISTLQTEMDDAEGRLDTAESDISTLQTDVDNRLNESHYDNLLSELAVCTLQSDASSGDTELSVSSSNLQLYDADKFVAFDPSDGTSVVVIVDGDQRLYTDPSTLTVSAIPSDISSGTHLLLDYGSDSVRGTDAAVDKIDSYLSGLSQSTSLSGMASNIETLQSDVSTLQGDTAGLDTQVSNLAASVNNQITNVENVSSRVTTLENEARLGVTSREKGDQEIAIVDWSQVGYSLDGMQSAKPELPVDSIQQILKEGDYLVAYNDEDGENYFVQLAPTSDTSGDVVYDPDQHSGGAVLDLQNSYSFDLPDDSSVFLAPISLRSEVSAVEDEVALRVKSSDVVSELSVQLDKITTKTDVFRNEDYNGDVDRSGDPTVPGTNDDGNVVTGDTGWALFEDGSAVFNDIYSRGFIEADRGVFKGGIRMDPGAGIQNADTTYSITELGFDLYAGADEDGPGRFYGLWDNVGGSFLGGLTANRKNTTPQVILDSLAGESILRSKQRALVRSIQSDVVLTATEGQIRLRSEDVISQDIWKASGISDLESQYQNKHGEDPPLNLHWIDTSDGNTLKLYEPGTITTSVDADFSVNTGVGDAHTVRVNDNSSVTGTEIAPASGHTNSPGYKYTWGDSDSSTPSDGTAEHTYNGDGDYTIELTATTVDGDTDTQQKTVSIPVVEEDPPNVPPPDIPDREYK